MTQPLSLIASAYMPTSSLSGEEPNAVYRARNCRIRGLGGNPYIESYLGSKDLSETITLIGKELTGSVYWAANNTAINGTGGTAFTTQLRPGQMIMAGTEHIVVNRVVSDVLFYAERAPTTTVLVGAAVTGYRLPVMFEIDGQRGVLLRGNAIVMENKDILFVGDGRLYLNGVDTTFDATRVPKRLQRAVAGTYTSVTFGFNTAPPAAAFDFTTGGWKNMIAGSYSFMNSWYNGTTGGFSNPSRNIQENATPVGLTIAAGGRFKADVTNVLAVKPDNADGLLIWGTLSGGGNAEVNNSNYHEGPWFEIRRFPFTAKTATALNTATDQITIANHNFQTGDYVIYKRTGGADIAGLTSGTVHADGGPSYWVIVVDENTIRLASSAANLKTSTYIDLTVAFPAGTHSFGFFDSNDVLVFEYLDAETGQTASGDNDAPPECEWIAEFAGQLQYISCFGNRVTDNVGDRGASFGSFVVPGKTANREAAPYRWRVGVEEDITGFAPGLGRLFVMTRKGIPFITPTGRTELARLAGTPLDIPYTWRPFWSKGSIQPYALSVIQNDVFLYSGNQPLRSPSTADVTVTPFEIGKLIYELTKNHPDGHVLFTHDPKNQQACLFLSGVRKNASGYWETEILPLDLTVQPNLWQPKILLTSTTQDMIVSGAAYINNRLEFLAGGRKAASNPEVRTYRYDERNGSGSVSWSAAFQPTDNG